MPQPLSTEVQCRLFVFFIVVAVLAVVLLVYDWVRDADGADDPGSSGSMTTLLTADRLRGTSPLDRGRSGVVAALGEVVRYGHQKMVAIADREYYCKNVTTQAQRGEVVQCNPSKPGSNDWGYTIAEVTDIRIDGQTTRVTWTSRNQYGVLHQEHEDLVYQDGRWHWHWIDHSTTKRIISLCVGIVCQTTGAAHPLQPDASLQAVSRIVRVSALLR